GPARLLPRQPAEHLYRPAHPSDARRGPDRGERHRSRRWRPPACGSNEGGRVRRWLPLAGVVALLGAALLAATFGNPPIASQPPAPQPTEEYIPPPVEDPEYATPSVDPSPFLLGEPVLPSWIGWVITAVCS